jgi:hypothetical protein
MEQSRMTQDDVLFGYRLQLFDLAARTTVAHACRTFGVHRSTYCRWKDIDCFYVGRLHGTRGAVWQLTAIDTHSSFAWAELVRCDGPGPDQGQTSRFAHRSPPPAPGAPAHRRSGTPHRPPAIATAAHPAPQAPRSGGRHRAA